MEEAQKEMAKSQLVTERVAETATAMTASSSGVVTDRLAAIF